MRKGLAALLLILMALPAYATFLNTPDGGRIRVGDTTTKVLIELGDPLRKTYSDVCTKTSKYGKCLRWSVVERWMYVQKELYWTLVISGERVREMDWSRR